MKQNDNFPSLKGRELFTNKLLNEMQRDVALLSKEDIYIVFSLKDVFANTTDNAKVEKMKVEHERIIKDFEIVYGKQINEQLKEIAEKDKEIKELNAKLKIADANFLGMTEISNRNYEIASSFKLQLQSEQEKNKKLIDEIEKKIGEKIKQYDKKYGELNMISSGLVEALYEIQKARDEKDEH